jgi:hypothetical protein
VSLSFKNISKYEYSLRELKNSTLCSETFMLFEDLKLEKTVPISDVKFIIDDDNMGKDLNIKVGLSTPLTKSFQGPPHLFQSLLDVGAIKDQSWTIKFLSKNDGIFVLGDEPHKYQDIKKDKRYQRKYFFKTDSLTGKEYYNPISIPSRKVYLHNKKGEEILLSENKGCYLNYNYGFILGTGDYRDYIRKNFFDELIDLHICSYDLVFFNDTDGITNSYYSISCDKTNFKKYYEKFPSLYFFVYDYNYNFELTKEDLFTIVNNKYYFLILFEKKIFDHEDLAFWSLGLPFLEKYEFVHNYEKNSVGFYIPYQEPDKDDDANTKVDSKGDEIKKDNKTEIIKNENNEKNENNDKKFYLTIIIILLIIGIILIIVAFLVAKKMYQKRQKKINELEENFDYVSKDNEKKEIN